MTLFGPCQFVPSRTSFNRKDGSSTKKDVQVPAKAAVNLDRLLNLAFCSKQGGPSGKKLPHWSSSGG